MPSLFYKATFERRFPLSFLFFEDIGIAAAEFDENPTPEQVELVIRRSLKRCFPDLKVAAGDVSYVSDRLEKFAEDLKKQAADADKDGPKKIKQDFASSYAQWASKLQPEEICLVAANMDYFMAVRLYTEVDKDDVVELSSQWMKREWEKIKVGYESVVYGFGGGYKEGSGSAGTTIDVSTDDNTQGKVISAAALKAVKF